ncbi:membrane dipeptidase [Novosphingobium sp. PhB165]|uniref:dipeptidase n=1 Tax=Novosphingobium sp. PhB165 TaxID=2485105 RepID=UPI00104DCD59|nr:membrane dipeptidase [Novosphingobium sp. PhB165]TCM19382.1 membrane dipeptidase [Novosphingobium sp. PhB165]
MDRREILTLAGGVVSAALLGPVAAYAAQAPERKSGRALVIDGNLVAPVDSPDPLDAETRAMVRSSGLDAFKITLGGSGNLSKAETDEQIASFSKGIAVNSDLFTKITSPADLAQAKRNGKVGVILSFEAAGMLEGRVENIDHFRSADVLVMGLTYNTVSPFGSGVLAPQSTGLTELGHAAVSRMNTLGTSIDISHSDERTSLEAMAASKKPVLITHAGCAAIHPHPRNKSDALLRTLADKGGVVGIYELAFLVPAPAQPGLDAYLAHIEHAVRVCGEDHVGIGTDGLLTPFDTSPESMKAWNDDIAERKKAGVSAPGEGPPPFVIGLNRPDRYAVIADALAKRGYSRRTLDKILGGNFERVFSETWQRA